MAHPHSGPGFLTHDPTPMDPKTVSYEPSNGPAVRTKRPGFVSHHGFLKEEPQKPITGPPTFDTKSYKRVDQIAPRKIENAAVASDFFSGLHTTHTANDATPKRRKPEAEPEVRARLEEQKREINEFLDAARRSKEESKQRDQVEKLKELDLVKSFDPWTKDGVHVSRKSSHRQQPEPKDTYVDKFFGKEGSGCPLRTKSGRARVTIPKDTETHLNNFFRFSIGANAIDHFREKPQESEDVKHVPRKDILNPRRVVDIERREELADSLRAQAEQAINRKTEQRYREKQWVPTTRQAIGGSYADIAARKRGSQMSSASSRVTSRAASRAPSSTSTRPSRVASSVAQN